MAAVAAVVNFYKILWTREIDKNETCRNKILLIIIIGTVLSWHSIIIYIITITIYYNTLWIITVFESVLQRTWPKFGVAHLSADRLTKNHTHTHFCQVQSLTIFMQVYIWIYNIHIYVHADGDIIITFDRVCTHQLYYIILSRVDLRKNTHNEYITRV